MDGEVKLIKPRRLRLSFTKSMSRMVGLKHFVRGNEAGSIVVRAGGSPALVTGDAVCSA